MIPHSDIRTCAKSPFDILGAVFFTITLLSLLTDLELGVYIGWILPIFLSLVISTVAAFLFFRWEIRHPDPILSAKLLLNRHIMWTYI